MIKLVYEYDNNEFVCQHGRINITKCINVLSALEKRALRYRKIVQLQIDTDEVMCNDTIDEIGTVSTESLINPDAECKEKYLYEKRGAEQFEMEEIKRVTDEVLKVHGIAPSKKGEGVTRVIYGNPNGFNSRTNRKEKLEKAEEIIDDLEVDIVAYREHRLKYKHKDNRNRSPQMFRGGIAEI